MIKQQNNRRVYKLLEAIQQAYGKVNMKNRVRESWWVRLRVGAGRINRVLKEASWDEACAKLHRDLGKSFLGESPGTPSGEW